VLPDAGHRQRLAITFPAAFDIKEE